MSIAEEEDDVDAVAGAGGALMTVLVLVAGEDEKPMGRAEVVAGEDAAAK